MTVRARGYARNRSGFTLLELIVVLLVGSVALGVSVVTFRNFQQSTTALRAAEVFARDLASARGTAMRQRQPVAVAFDDQELVYWIRSGEQLFLTRQFSSGGQIPLSAISLDLLGDSVLFTARGIADLSEAALGTASFRAGSRTFIVEFNALGSSEVRPLE